MLSVSDYDSQKNDSDLTKFAEYDITQNPLPKYQIWQNLSNGPYIVTYDSELKPSIMYRFSPFFKKEKINNPRIILAEDQVTEFYFSYNISCTPENIKQIIGLNSDYYLSLDMMKNNTLMAQKLLDRIDANIINKEKDTIITKGVIEGNIIFVTEALKRISKTTLNIQNKRGYTALLLALAYQNIPLIKEIMKYKPDLKFKDNQGLDANYYANYYNIDLSDLITPEFKNLKTAIKNNNLREVESLLDKLKYMNESDSNGYTILMYAVATNNNLEIVKAVLKKNPDLSIQNSDKKTALDIAKVSKKTDMIKLLEDYQAVSLKPRLLKPISSFNPQVKPVKKVIIEPIKEKASKELSALINAVAKDDQTRVESLLDVVKNINEYDSNGWTALMHSVVDDEHIEITKAILKKNPDLSIKNLDEETALDIAKIFGNKNTVKLLEDYSSKPVNANVRPVNVVVRPVNVKPKGRNDKCDIVDSLTVVKLNDVFKEINQPIPAAKVLKAERLHILKDLLGC
jgi:ankyrin repeat protein